MVYHTYGLYQSLDYKSILKSCDFQSHPVVSMAMCKTRVQSQKEIQRMLEESGSEGDHDVLSESDKSVNSESYSDSELEEEPEENSESSDCDMTPPPQKITKEEGWKWIVTGDRPSKLHFTGNPGIKPAIIRNLPPEPNHWKFFNSWSTTHCGMK